MSKYTIILYNVIYIVKIIEKLYKIFYIILYGNHKIYKI